MGPPLGKKPAGGEEGGFTFPSPRGAALNKRLYDIRLRNLYSRHTDHRRHANLKFASPPKFDQKKRKIPLPRPPAPGPRPPAPGPRPPAPGPRPPAFGAT